MKPTKSMFTFAGMGPVLLVLFWSLVSDVRVLENVGGKRQRSEIRFKSWIFHFARQVALNKYVRNRRAVAVVWV